MRGLGLSLAVFGAVLLTTGPPAGAELRIATLDVFLNDHALTVTVAAQGTVPASVAEGLHGGLPAHLRFTIELWQYNRYWRDRLLARQVVERQLAYNLVTREYRVSFGRDEPRPSYVTRDLRDAERVLSEVRAVRLGPAQAVAARNVIYVRVLAETALNGENTVISRMAGTAERTVRQSDYRTMLRVP